jgi:hypothetical protein
MYSFQKYLRSNNRSDISILSKHTLFHCDPNCEMFTEVSIEAGNNLEFEFLFYKCKYYTLAGDVLVTARHLLCALFI